jgi:hypothetical protein
MPPRNGFSEAAIVHFLQQLTTCQDQSLFEDKALRVTAVKDHLVQSSDVKQMDVEQLAVLSATALKNGLQLICKHHPSRRASMCLGIIETMLRDLLDVLKRDIIDRLPMAERQQKRQQVAMRLAATGEAAAHVYTSRPGIMLIGNQHFQRNELLELLANPSNDNGCCLLAAACSCRSAGSNQGSLPGSGITPGGYQQHSSTRQGAGGQPHLHHAAQRCCGLSHPQEQPQLTG